MKFRISSESISREFELTEDDLWENVRYLLETKLGIHEDSYIEGYYDFNLDREPLRRDEIIHPTDSLIIFRKPLIRNDMKPYTPQKYRPLTTFNEILPTNPCDNIDQFIEESKNAYTIFLIGGGTDNDKKRKRINEQHASELKIQEIPPQWYTCYCCGMKGHHYRRDCPKNAEDDFIPINHRGVPHGIPKTKLREAVTEDEKKRAYIDETGKYVLWRIDQ